MTRHALILALLVPLGATYHPQYVPTRAFPTATVFNPCLVTGWPMNEGSGTVLNDVSGNSNTANINNLSNVSWGSNAGFPGSSLLFTGSISTNVTATSTTLADFTGTTPFSVAAWIKITAAGHPQTFMTTLQPSQYQGWEFGTGTIAGDPPLLDFIISNTFGSNAIAVHGSTNIQDGAKHFVVGTYDGTRTGTTGGVKLYVDGVLETMVTDQNNLSATAATGRTVKIALRPPDGLALAGILAAPAIYNCVLTPTQVSTYNGLGPQVN